MSPRAEAPGGEGPLRVLTTGDPDATRDAARRAFGVETGPVLGVDPRTFASR